MHSDQAEGESVPIPPVLQWIYLLKQNIGFQLITHGKHLLLDRGEISITGTELIVGEVEAHPEKHNLAMLALQLMGKVN